MGSGLNNERGLAQYTLRWRHVFIAGDKSSCGALWHEPPVVEFTRLDKEMVVSWPASRTNYVLETSNNLHNAPWTSALREPILSNGKLTYRVRTEADAQFFRLRQSEMVGTD
jgi:hypothetical protein